MTRDADEQDRAQNQKQRKNRNSSRPTNQFVLISFLQHSTVFNEFEFHRLQTYIQNMIQGNSHQRPSYVSGSVCRNRNILLNHVQWVDKHRQCCLIWHRLVKNICQLCQLRSDFLRQSMFQCVRLIPHRRNKIVNFSSRCQNFKKSIVQVVISIQSYEKRKFEYFPFDTRKKGEHEKREKNQSSKLNQIWFDGEKNVKKKLDEDDCEHDSWSCGEIYDVCVWKGKMRQRLLYGEIWDEICS